MYVCIGVYIQSCRTYNLNQEGSNLGPRIPKPYSQQRADLVDRILKKPGLYQLVRLLHSPLELAVLVGQRVF
jgi:hypothetical protein